MAQNITLKDASTNESLYPQTTLDNIVGIPEWVKSANKPSYNYSEISNTPNSLPASDVYNWAKQPTKPSYQYSEIGYTSSSVSKSGTATIDGSIPLYLITATGNITSLSFTTAVPLEGHSCHCIITASSAYTLAIAHNGTVTIDGTTYTFKCPEATNISLTLKANGYLEVDFLRIGTNIYVRGV